MATLPQSVNIVKTLLYTAHRYYITPYIGYLLVSE